MHIGFRVTYPLVV